MGRTLDIAGGIMLGGLAFVGGYGIMDFLGSRLAQKEFQKDMGNFQYLKGVVVEENFYPSFTNAKYDVSIKTFDGKKSVVHFSQWVLGNEPKILNSLFSPGDTVVLEVVTNKEFNGDQRYGGVAGKLYQK